MAHFLVQAGLLKWLGSGTVYFTPAGRKEVEDAIRNPSRSTEHFGAPIVQQVIHFHGAVGVGVQSGGTSNVEQQIGSSTQEVFKILRDIRAALPEDAQDAREAVDDLESELKTPAPKPSRIKAFASALWGNAPKVVDLSTKLLDLYHRLNVPPPAG